MFTYKYPHPALTADCIILAFDGTALKILLVERKNNPYAGCWAFPGGFLEIDETIETTAKRELTEETGISCDSFKQFRVYSAVDRDSRERVITVAFYALFSYLPTAKAADDAKQLRWFDVGNLPSLAFDHQEILSDVFGELRLRCHTEPVVFRLLPSLFSMDMLKYVYETVTGSKYTMTDFSSFIDQFNFVEKVSTKPGMFRFSVDKYNSYIRDLDISVF